MAQPLEAQGRQGFQMDIVIASAVILAPGQARQPLDQNCLRNGGQDQQRSQGLLLLHSQEVHQSHQFPHQRQQSIDVLQKNEAIPWELHLQNSGKGSGQVEEHKSDKE